MNKRETHELVKKLQHEEHKSKLNNKLWKNQVIYKKLAKARAENDYKLYKWRKRQARIDKINNSAPLVQNSLMLKWCICIIIVMCILTFNLTGTIGIDNQIQYHDYELEDLRYEREYVESFYDENTALNKIIAMGKSVEIYGQNSAWTKIINAFANIKGFKSGVETTMTIALLPINLAINFGTFFINLINSWTGQELLTPWKLKYDPNVKGVIDVISFPNLWTWVF